MPAEPVIEVSPGALVMAQGIDELVRRANVTGQAEGLEIAADYIDNLVIEVGIIGEFRDMLVVMRDHLLGFATELSAPLFDSTLLEEPHAQRPRQNDL